jgi:hypothetical protein
MITFHCEVNEARTNPRLYRQRNCVRPVGAFDLASFEGGWILLGELRLIDRSEMPQAFVERLAWRAAIAFILFLILLYCTLAALVAGGFYRLEL